MSNMDSWWLDLKLGLRMLWKYPGLALAGGAGIAVAVAIAAGGYSVVAANYRPEALPLPASERLVVLEEWDSARNRPEARLGYDFAEWRQSLRSVEHISAFRSLQWNWMEAGSAPRSPRIAAISATGFAAAGVAPLLGRLFTEDEPGVALIGEALWKSRWGASPNILGATLRLGAGVYRVVGVMPSGFAFPVNHEIWVPLQAPANLGGPAEGPELTVFGRLKPEASLDQAQAELATFAGRRAISHPDLYRHLRVQALPFPLPFLGMHSQGDLGGLYLLQGLVATLLVLVSLNVAILVFTRTCARQSEIAIRTALGANRSRIVGQLFLEALVLSVLAALAGLGLAHWSLGHLGGITQSLATQDLVNQLPYWLRFELTPSAILYAIGLSVLAAAIAGVLPALQATRMHKPLAGMGKLWSSLVVAQVAFAVALLPGGLSLAWDSTRPALADLGFPAAEFLSTELRSPEGPPLPLEQLFSKLRQAPQVAALAHSRHTPGDEPPIKIETESLGAQTVRWNEVDRNFFATLGVSLQAGRNFGSEDGLVVNESLARHLFAGHALGRRLRWAEHNWRPIVGIVRDFPAAVSPGLEHASMAVYTLAQSPSTPLSLSLRIRPEGTGGNSLAFAPRLREIAAAVNPELLLRNPNTLEAVMRREQWIRQLEAALILSVALSVLLLSSAGIYALMSFTVSQRRKEIGIRTALGADRLQILRGIFSRAVRQLGLGAALGALMCLGLEWAAGGNLFQGSGAIVLPAVAIAIMLVGLAATAGPARRCLEIQPTEALRER